MDRIANRHFSCLAEQYSQINYITSNWYHHFIAKNLCVVDFSLGVKP